MSCKEAGGYCFSPHIWEAVFAPDASESAELKEKTAPMMSSTDPLCLMECGVTTTPKHR